MREQNVKICKGPGCKAWSADQIARELLEVREGLDLENLKVCRVPCMRVCGGGATIRVNANSRIKKFKQMEDVLRVLGIRDGVASCM
jgi:hypothetical protein